MTLYQALVVQWLTEREDCSQRATAGRYFSRYDKEGVQHKKKSHYKGTGGTQAEGIALREQAMKVLYQNNRFFFFDPSGVERTPENCTDCKHAKQTISGKQCNLEMRIDWILYTKTKSAMMIANHPIPKKGILEHCKLKRK